MNDLVILGLYLIAVSAVGIIIGYVLKCIGQRLM